jgi:hypothetical protein
MELYMHRLLALVFTAVLTQALRAECVAQSAPLRPHLIELYSSEGCSSCPPAESWLRTLHDDANTVALEFHVDYWDALGWPDRFADPRYTARQQTLAARGGNGIVYTPEVALDGREWRDWYRHGALPSSANSGATLKLTVASGVALHVHLDVTLANPVDAAAYRSYVALAEDDLSSQVRAGENRGVLLQHDHVVRAFIGPLPLTSDADVPVPADVDLARATLVAFAQREQDGAIAQVVTLPLVQCRK